MAAKCIEASLNEIAQITGVREGDNVMGFAMHPDDFSALHAEAIRIFQALGAVVHLATGSKGENSTKGDQSLVKSGYRIDVEAVHEAEALGIQDKDQCHFLGMPDITYGEKSERDKLTGVIGVKMELVKPVAMFSAGPQGFDGHRGHIEGHNSMVAARDMLGYTATVWGLVDLEEASLVLPVDRDHKEWAVAQNETQFPNTNDPTARRVAFAAEALAELLPYRRLFEAETYERF